MAAVGALNGRVDTPAERVDILTERADGLDVKIDANRQAINALGEKLAGFQAETRERFDAIDGRFEAIDGRFDALEQKHEREVPQRRGRPGRTQRPDHRPARPPLSVAERGGRGSVCAVRKEETARPDRQPGVWRPLLFVDNHAYPSNVLELISAQTVSFFRAARKH